MPKYEFLNTTNNQIEEHFMRISEYDQFVIDNPTLKRYHSTAPAFSYSGTKDFNTKTDNTWKEVLSKIAEKHPASQLAETHGKRTIKEHKTREVLKKHAKIQQKQRK